MAKEKGLRSAYELAMERLQKEDQEAGIERQEPLTRQQKETIADLRQRAKAKLAELEILHRKELVAAAQDPEQLTKAEEQYETDRRRVESSLETAVARVRRNEPAGELD